MRESIFDKDSNELITLAEAESLGLGLRNTLQVQILKGLRKGIKVGRDWLIIKHKKDNPHE